MVLEFERIYRVKLPENYISFLKENNGAIPILKSFTFDNNIYAIEGFLCLLGDKVNDYDEGDYDIEIVMTRNDSTMCDDANLVGANIVPILALNGGNYVCLDYRNDESEPEICIWYWNKSEKFKAFTNKISNNFEEFLNILDLGIVEFN